MTSIISTAGIPDKLTDADARRILEEAAPQVRELQDQILRNNARAEEGTRAFGALMAKANEGFGTDDGTGKKVVPGGEAGVRKILDERMVENAQRVRTYLAAVAEAQQKVAALARPTQGH